MVLGAACILTFYSLYNLDKYSVPSTYSTQ